mgnify:CR=1 FL=1
MLGPPGPGTTSFLRQIDLTPLSLRRGPLVGGMGGARGCDWLFFHEAVFLIGSGLFAIHEEPAAWGRFLELVAWYRPPVPVQGIVLTLALNDLLISSEDQEREYVRKFRDRIGELESRLKVRAPTYLVFTKLDLLNGFAERFASLDEPERSRVLGVPFPLDDGVRPAALFGEFCREWHERWMAEGPSEFSRQFLLALPRLTGFLERLEGTFLRGAYLTSATQEGLPLDLTGTARPLVQERTAGSRSYFIRRLGSGVLLPDVELAQPAD